jgi:hypothetical protein
MSARGRASRFCWTPDFSRDCFENFPASLHEVLAVKPPTVSARATPGLRKQAGRFISALTIPQARWRHTGVFLLPSPASQDARQQAAV